MKNEWLNVLQPWNALEAVSQRCPKSGAIPFEILRLARRANPTRSSSNDPTRPVPISLTPIFPTRIGGLDIIGDELRSQLFGSSTESRLVGVDLGWRRGGPRVVDRTV